MSAFTRLVHGGRRHQQLFPSVAQRRRLCASAPVDSNVMMLHAAAVPGPYDSIRLDARSISPHVIATALNEAVAEWRASRRNSVWLTIGLASGAALDAAGRAGFKFHHGLGDSAVLLLWLPADVPCAVPPYATHQVGVAGVLVDADRRLLVVQDVGKKRIWKFAGGLANLGEDFGATAVRETFEETGVRSRFVSVLALRHSHGAAPWGVSDLYVLCRLEPLSTSIDADPHEIAACEWVDGAKFVAECEHPLNRFVAQAALSDFDSERSRGDLVGHAVNGANSSCILEEDVMIAGRVVKCYRSSGAMGLDLK